LSLKNPLALAMGSVSTDVDCGFVVVPWMPSCQDKANLYMTFSCN